MQKVYVVVNGHVPTTFKSLGGARKFAAQILKTYRGLGLEMTTVRRGKLWKAYVVGIRPNAHGIVVTLTETKCY